MTHTITIHLTQQAQREALLAGEPAKAEQVYPIHREDLLARVLALPGAKVERDGRVVVRGLPSLRVGRDETDSAEIPGYRVAWGSGSVETVTVTRRPADAAGAIAAYEARAAEIEAEASAKAREVRAQARRWAALPLDEQVFAHRHSSGLRIVLPDGPAISQSDLREWVPEALDSAKSELERRRLAIQAERERAQAERRREREDRLAHLADLVKCYAPDAIERIEAAPDLGPLGLVDESEALDLVRDALLPVGRHGLAALVWLDDDTTREEMNCDCDGYGSVSYRERALLDDVCSAEQYRAARELERVVRAGLELRGAPGELTLTLTIHEGRCEHDNCPEDYAWRVGCRAVIDLGGGIVVEREYGAA